MTSASLTLYLPESCCLGISRDLHSFQLKTNYVKTYKYCLPPNWREASTLFLTDSKYQQSEMISPTSCGVPEVRQGGAGERAGLEGSPWWHRFMRTKTKPMWLKDPWLKHKQSSPALHSQPPHQRKTEGELKLRFPSVFCFTEQKESVPHPLAAFHFQRHSYSWCLGISARHVLKSAISPFFSPACG